MAQVTDFSFFGTFMAKRPVFLPKGVAFLVMKLAFTQKKSAAIFTQKKSVLAFTATNPSIAFTKIDC